MKRMFLLLILIVLITIDLIGQTIPKQINYQGILKDATGNLLTGDYALTFKIYNEPTGGAPLWTEIQVLSVTNGLFDTQLGKQTPITGVPFDRTHFLGIQVGTSAELTPRTMLTPSPYSFMTMNVIDNTVVKSLNGLRDDVNLVAGSNITITPSGNDLTISAGGVSGIIGGTGTINYIPLFTSSSILGNSILFQDGNGNIQLGTDGSAGELRLSAWDNQYEGGQIKWSGAGSYDDWLQDSYLNNMRFITNSTNTSTFEISNVGSGKANLNVEGEIQTQRTGDANMVPIAYAYVFSDGSLDPEKSTNNVVLVAHSSTGQYEFTISGTMNDQLMCVASLEWNLSGFGFIYYAHGSHLYFNTGDKNGNMEDRNFSFVVYKK